jgi:hypothetical protein
MRLGCKALRLKAKQAGPIENVHLGKMYVVKPSTKNKAPTDFESGPQRSSRAPDNLPLPLGACSPAAHGCLDGLVNNSVDAAAGLTLG